MPFCDGVLIHPQDTILMREFEQPHTSEDRAGDVFVDQGLINQKRLAEEPDPSLGIGESDERHATVAEGQLPSVLRKALGQQPAPGCRVDLPGNALPELGVRHHDAGRALTDDQRYYLVRNGARWLTQEAPWLAGVLWRPVNRLRLFYHTVARHDTVREALAHASRGVTGQRPGLPNTS